MILDQQCTLTTSSPPGLGFCVPADLPTRSLDTTRVSRQVTATVTQSGGGPWLPYAGASRGNLIESLLCTYLLDFSFNLYQLPFAIFGSVSKTFLDQFKSMKLRRSWTDPLQKLSERFTPFWDNANFTFFGLAP